MKRRKILYVMKHKGKLCAISEDLKELLKYKSQFPEYFKPEDCVFDVITDKKTICKLYQTEKLILEWLTNDIIVTQWEWYYYDKQLRQSYADTKSMMSQMILYIKLSALSVEEKYQIKQTFDMLYGHIKCYQDFLSSLDTNEVMNKYIMNPDVCKETIEMDERYHLLMNEFN